MPLCAVARPATVRAASTAVLHMHLRKPQVHV